MNKDKGSAEPRKLFERTDLFGRILLDRGLVTPAQLQQALARQDVERRRLGDILVEMGALSEVDVVVALVLQCHCPYVAVDQCQIDPEVARLIPEELARKHGMVALDKVGDVLSIVMSDPVDAPARQEVEQACGCRVAVFVSTPRKISRALQQAYGP